jgi:hypothetical protein
MGVFLSFSIQVAYDAIKEYPAFQSISLVTRINVLSVVFGAATVVLIIYYFRNEIKLIREKS